ncbi:hypothetical protein ABT336_20125 [Micromonospora sp. NPDC000207]|uniref:hypothetical protein n=1 Tax=Micromonospora sp. NPDC000207 TaxID=3154246 RepID=UPI00331D56CD
MSIGEVKAALEESKRLLDQGRATMEGIDISLAEVTSLTLATLHDTQHAEAGSARRTLADAARQADLALSMISAATENTSTYLRELG